MVVTQVLAEATAVATAVPMDWAVDCATDVHSHHSSPAVEQDSKNHTARHSLQAMDILRLA